MTIHRFTADEFRKALPVHKDSGRPLWKEEGYVNGELCFTIPVVQEGEKSDIFILVRSSIKFEGKAGATGKDSIRAWLAGPTGVPIGSKVKSFITRKVGWEGRLTTTLRELWSRAKTITTCPDCELPMGVYEVKKTGPKKGHLFTKCWTHGHFRWVNTEGLTPRRSFKGKTFRQ